MGARASSPRWAKGLSSSTRAGCPRLYGPPRICKGVVVRASRFSCTLVSGLCGGNCGSRALMGSAHTSPHLPDGLERAQRGLRLVACRSDLSCHRLHFPSQRLASSCSPRWLALGGPSPVVVRRVRRARSDIHGLSTGAGPLTRPSAGGQAVDIAPSLMAPLSSRSGPTYAGSTRYSCSRTSSAQAVRAVLFANATAAMFAPRRPCTDTAQRLRRSSRLAAARNAARAP